MLCALYVGSLEQDDKLQSWLFHYILALWLHAHKQKLYAFSSTLRKNEDFNYTTFMKCAWNGKVFTARCNRFAAIANFSLQMQWLGSRHGVACTLHSAHVTKTAVQLREKNVAWYL